MGSEKRTRGLDGVLGGLGGAVASAGGLLHATPGNTNPLGNTLAHATSAVSSLTGGLGLGGITGGGANGGLLAPVTGLLAGVTGNLGGGCL
ncbi:hypothetical protein ABFO09_19765, partial [Bordetella pertussis]